MMLNLPSKILEDCFCSSLSFGPSGTENECGASSRGWGGAEGFTGNFIFIVCNKEHTTFHYSSYTILFDFFSKNLDGA